MERRDQASSTGARPKRSSAVSKSLSPTKDEVTSPEKGKTPRKSSLDSKYSSQKKDEVTSPEKGKTPRKSSLDSKSPPPTKVSILTSPKRLFNRAKSILSPTRSPKSPTSPTVSSVSTATDTGHLKQQKVVQVLKYGHFVFECPLLPGVIFYESLDDEKVIPTFLSKRTCHDVMPISGKVVLLCDDMLAKKAFQALLKNDIRAAPLWRSSSSSFVGMLTITDFINVLIYYYKYKRAEIRDIENLQISIVKSHAEERPFIQASPTDTLVNATKLLIENKVHRLPVYDKLTGNVLTVMSRRRLLKYLYFNIYNFRTHFKASAFWNRSIEVLKTWIGTWENIVTVTINTRVIDALTLFCDHQVSSLPVMDKDGRLKDIFAKFDVFALAEGGEYDNLDITVQQALDRVEASFLVHEAVETCELSDYLETVIKKFVTTKVHRLLFLDEKKAVIGIVSLSDILKFLVLQHLEELPPNTDEAPEGAVGGQGDSSVSLGSDQESSENLQKSSSLDKQDSSDLPGDFEKLQLEADTPEPLSEASVCEDVP